jgi:predicted HTH domain antitoxin
MTTVQIALPEASVQYLGVPEQQTGRALLEEAAAKMYEEGKISLSQGKDMLGQESITDFMHTLCEHDTPVIDYDLDDFKRELRDIGVMAC